MSRTTWRWILRITEIETVLCLPRNTWSSFPSLQCWKNKELRDVISSLRCCNWIQQRGDIFLTNCDWHESALLLLCMRKSQFGDEMNTDVKNCEQSYMNFRNFASNRQTMFCSQRNIIFTNFQVLFYMLNMI